MSGLSTDADPLGRPAQVRAIGSTLPSKLFKILRAGYRRVNRNLLSSHNAPHLHNALRGSNKLKRDRYEPSRNWTPLVDAYVFRDGPPNDRAASVDTLATLGKDPVSCLRARESEGRYNVSGGFRTTVEPVAK